MEYIVLIPNCYVWMTEGAANRPQLFKRYVTGYVERHHHELKIKSIKGMYVICERKQRIV